MCGGGRAMLIEMPLYLYILAGVLTSAVAFLVKRKYMVPKLDLNDPLDFAFNIFMNLVVFFVGSVWPVTLGMFAFSGVLGGIGYLLWRLRHGR
jgi:hypothetical protein